MLQHLATIPNRIRHSPPGIAGPGKIARSDSCRPPEPLIDDVTPGDTFDGDYQLMNCSASSRSRPTINTDAHVVLAAVPQMGRLRRTPPFISPSDQPRQRVVCAGIVSSAIWPIDDRSFASSLPPGRQRGIDTSIEVDFPMSGAIVPASP